MEVKCPRCGETTNFSSANPFRPFCSERCKLIDLGAWAEGKYTIPVEDLSDVDDVDVVDESPNHDDESEAGPLH